MTCPKTTCGFDAPDPIGDEEILACPNGGALITPDELVIHPNGCSISSGHADFVQGLIEAVSSRIADYYGVPTIAPCLGVRCFPVDSCGNVRIDPMLRVDEVEIAGGCTCGEPCDRVYTAVDLCDLVVDGDLDLPPWTGMRLCGTLALCGRGSARVTGVFGQMWPIPPAIKAIAIMAVARLYRAATKSGDVITNREDGSLKFDVTDLAISKELSLLPTGLFSYQWRPV